MTAELLQNLRFLVIYPVLAVGGLAWAVTFHLRWRKTHCRGDAWTAVLATSIAGWAFAAIIALFIASLSGFSSLTSITITVGLLAPAVVIGVGTVVLFARALSNHGNTD